MMQTKNSPSIKTQWAIAQMRELEQKGLFASSGENEMGKASGIDVATVRQMILEGKTNNQIAEHYGIAVVSVRNFRQRNKQNQMKIASELKQERPSTLEIDDAPIQPQETQEVIEPVTHDAPGNVQAMSIEEHNRVLSLDDLDDDWMLPTPTATVGQRIDVILSQLHPSDSETVRKTFGLLCGRIISEHIGL